MAQPPKKPPVLPGLGGEPLTPKLRSPTRPGLPGLPGLPSATTQAPALSINQKQIALNRLAARIARAGKYAVVLEAHTSSVLAALATNDEVASILRKSGFATIYSEVDARMLRPSSANAVFSKTLQRLSAPPKAAAARDGSARLFSAFAQTVQNVFLSSTSIPVRAVGDEFVGANEALQIVRTRFGRDPLSIEQAYLAGVKVQRDREAKRNPGSKAVRLLDKILAQNPPFPEALMDMLNFATYMPNDAGDKQKYISGMARELADPINQKHIDELTAVFDEVIRLRTDGPGDTHMARNGLAHAQGNSVLFIVGAAHGLSKRAQSLPTQLAVQADVSETDVQVLLPMQKIHERMFYNEMLILQNKGELRDDIIVIDMESGDEMNADAWMKKMKSTFTPPATPTGTPPQP